MSVSIEYLQWESPLGPLLICTCQERIIRLGFGSIRDSGFRIPGCQYRPETNANSVGQRAVEQLREYFQGERTTFDLPLAPTGTTFQQRAWQILQRIPYGATISYGQQAALLGGRQYARAVGYANHKNPIAIVIPCHRVIGSQGQLTGYAAGLEKKKWLLEFEAANLALP